MPSLVISKLAADNGIEITDSAASKAYKDLEDLGGVALEKAGLPVPDLIARGIFAFAGWLGLGRKPRKIQQNVLVATYLTQYFAQAGKQAELFGNVCKLNTPINGQAVFTIAEQVIKNLRSAYKPGTDDYYDLGLGLNSLEIIKENVFVTTASQKVPIAQWTETIVTGSSTGDTSGSGSSSGGGSQGGGSGSPPTSPDQNESSPIAIPALGLLAYFLLK